MHEPTRYLGALLVFTSLTAFATDTKKYLGKLTTSHDLASNTVIHTIGRAVPNGTEYGNGSVARTSDGVLHVQWTTVTKVQRKPGEPMTLLAATTGGSSVDALSNARLTGMPEVSASRATVVPGATVCSAIGGPASCSTSSCTCYGLSGSGGNCPTDTGSYTISCTDTGLGCSLSPITSGNFCIKVVQGANDPNAILSRAP